MKRLLLGLVMVVGLSYQLFAQASEKELFLRAENRFQSQKYELALDLYNQFLEQYPISRYTAEALFKKGICLYRTQRYYEAISLFREIDKKFIDFRFKPFLPFWLGITLYSAAEYTQALTALNTFLATNRISPDTDEQTTASYSLPANPEEADLVRQALLYRTYSLIGLGRHPQALKSFQIFFSLTADPLTQPYALSVYFALCVREGQFSVPVAYYKDIDFSDVPYREKLWFYVAESYWGLGQTAEAERVYVLLFDAEESIAVIAYQRVFLIRQKSGDRQKIIELIAQAESGLKANTPVLMDFWLRIAIESFKARDYTQAEFFLLKAWNLRSTYPPNSLVILYLAEIYTLEEKYSDSLKLIGEYLRIRVDGIRSDPNGALLYLRLVMLYAKTADWANAVSYGLLAYRQYPTAPSHSEAGYYLAYAYYKQGLVDDALAIIAELLILVPTPPNADRLLKLKARCEQSQGDDTAALSSLKAYLFTNPHDAQAYLEFMKILFEQKNFQQVAAAADDLDKNIPKLREGDPAAYYTSRYLAGLALLGLKDYKKALACLTLIPDSLDKETPEVQAIFKFFHGYALYYRGWVNFRLTDYKAAVSGFLLLLKLYPEHPFQVKATYNAAWCSYKMEDYTQAAKFLLKLTGQDKLHIEYRDKALFLLGKVYISLKQPDQAALYLQKLFMDNPASTLADDALFEYAGLLAVLNKSDDAAAAYRKLFENYPASPLREESLYKRGEIMLQAKLYDKARFAFYEFRNYFPDSQLVDSALYWGGIASFYLNEKYQAVLLWEKLITTYPKSPFRSDALYRSAEIYRGLEDYRKAFNYYSELANTYPAESATLGVAVKLKELQYLLLGLNDKEAKLLAQIETSGGVKTQTGRTLILEICRLYLSEGKEDLAYSLLSEIANFSGADRDSLAQAYYLLAEFYLLKGNLKEAGNAFVKAATANPSQKDFTAHALYRAAETAWKAGSRQEAAALVERIKDNFPDSEWARQGRLLLGKE